MTKFYPLVLVPALWQRRDWKMPTAVVAVVAVGYAVYASAGRHELGFLFDYAREEGIDNGTRFFLLEFAQRVLRLGWVTTQMYEAVCAVVLGAIALLSLRYATVERFSSHPSAIKLRTDGAPKFLWASMAMAFAMMLLFSPHYAWYLAWLVPMLALVPNVPLLTYVLMFFYMYTTALAEPGPKTFLLNKILYATVAGAFVVSFAFRRVDVWRWLRREPAER
jgi:alpha-1,6-mannosyltransferase